MKRLWRAQPERFAPYIERFLSEISRIHQASTQWTLAQMFHELDALLTAPQRRDAIAVLKKNLETTDDWIVLIKRLRRLATGPERRPR